METQKKLLKAEVKETLDFLAHKGNTRTIENSGRKGENDSFEWEQLLDKLFDEVYEFAKSKGIETE